METCTKINRSSISEPQNNQIKLQNINTQHNIEYIWNYKLTQNIIHNKLIHSKFQTWMETLVKGFVFCITKPHFLKLCQGKNKHIHHYQAAVGTCLLVSAVYRPSTSAPTDKTDQEERPASYSVGTRRGRGRGGLSPQLDQLGFKTAQSPPATSF